MLSPSVRPVPRPRPLKAVRPPFEILRDLLRRAQRAPFYKGRLKVEKLDDYEDWQRLPLTTKAHLRQAYPFGLLAVDKKELATYHESSGTSGEPTSSYFTDEDWDDIASRFARSAVNLGPGDALIVKTPYAMVTTAHQAHRAARLRGALVIPADNRSTNMPYSRVVRLLKDVPATVAWCMPSEALVWAAAAELAGLDPASEFPKLRAFVVAGEAMSHGRKRRIAEIWGNARVFEDYGSTETGSLAGECAHGLLHLWADRLFAEVLDPLTNRASFFGKGKLVVTPLFRQAMPLVRYCLEDIVELSPVRCACGSPLPTIRCLGRTDSKAVIQGNELFPGELEDAVYRLPARHGVLFWRARHTPRALEVEIGPAPGEEGAARELQAQIALRFGINAEVRAVDWRQLVDAGQLTRPTSFQKPRYLFGPAEDWNQAIRY